MNETLLPQQSRSIKLCAVWKSVTSSSSFSSYPSVQSSYILSSHALPSTAAPRHQQERQQMQEEEEEEEEEEDEEEEEEPVRGGVCNTINVAGPGTEQRPH
ncbi:hypothetical protein E2C01_071458 [Portunus trituberculatus]|uniref:Uncharacterized protein n=1 Tax=Portunus trituberculatus TaxID=210409 RepID=A0A5B7I560_PORTR|nr:hypothetical protein [Portunus trituberculatus]